MDTRAKILEILEELTDQPAAQIDSTDRLAEDLGMDSVDAVQFLALVSEAFDADIPIDEVGKIRTVGDVFALAEKHLGGG